MEDAEYGDLDHTVISKRHVRILSALYQVAQNIHRYDLGVNYVNIPVLLDIIEVMFGKRHTENDIWLFTKELHPRGYIAFLHEQNEEDEPGIIAEYYIAITSYGSQLLAQISSLRPSLFDSCSRNSIKGLC